MATEYISRESAWNGIYNCPTKRDEDGYIWVRTIDAVHKIDDIPAADVRPVVRGEWHDVYQVAGGIVAQTCSVCKKYHQTSVKCSMPQLCPNCGADMRPAAGGR